MHGESFPEANNQHRSIFLVNRGVVQVDVVHQLDRLGVVHGGPAHSHPQLELPRHLDREEEPGDNPEEEVKHGGNDKDQDGAVEGAFVDDGEVIEQGSVADSEGDQRAHGRRVREVHPQGGLALGKLDCLLYIIIASLYVYMITSSHNHIVKS